MTQSTPSSAVLSQLDLSLVAPARPIGIWFARILRLQYHPYTPEMPLLFVPAATHKGKIVGVMLLASGAMIYEFKAAPALVKKALREHYTGDILDFVAVASVETRLDICKQLCRIVHELHRKDIIHGSICIANVKWDSGTISLTNAGLFAEIQREVEQVPLLPCTRFRSKEELERDEYIPSKDGDLYAFTALVYAIFAAKEPYHDLSLPRCVSKIARAGHAGLEKPEMMPFALWSALQVYWNASPEGRKDMFGSVQAALL